MSDVTQILGKKGLFQVGGDANAIVEGVANEVSASGKYVRLDSETASGVNQSWYRIGHLSFIEELSTEPPVP